MHTCNHRSHTKHVLLILLHSPICGPQQQRVSDEVVVLAQARPPNSHGLTHTKTRYCYCCSILYLDPSSASAAKLICSSTKVEMKKYEWS